MTYGEFKQERNKLIAKLSVLAIKITEQGNYYASFVTNGCVGSVSCSITSAEESVFDQFTLYSTAVNCYNCKKFVMFTEDTDARYYTSILDDLKNIYDRMSKFLKELDKVEIIEGEYSRGGDSFKMKRD